MCGFPAPIGVLTCLHGEQYLLKAVDAENLGDLELETDELRFMVRSHCFHLYYHLDCPFLYFVIPFQNYHDRCFEAMEERLQSFNQMVTLDILQLTEHSGVAHQHYGT